MEDVQKEAARLREMGYNVEVPAGSMKDVYPTLDEEPRHYLGAGMTFIHFQRIREADIVWVYNPGGYIGTSVTMEMAFACALAKPIYTLEKDTDGARGTLVTGIRTADELGAMQHPRR